MTRRAFDGTTLGAPSTVTTGIDWSTIRGAFAVSGRLYFRWLTPESGTLGADTFVASGATDGATGPPSPG
jgi:hypothetical protein